MDVVILAGGSGSRMGDLVREVPKAMVPIAGKPILEHQLGFAARHGVDRAILLTGRLGEVVERFVGDGSRWGLRVECVREAEPLGTAGAVRSIAEKLRDDFLVFYGDTIFDLDLDALLAFHRDRGGAGTLLVHPNDHPCDSDLLDADDAGRITAFHRKPRPEGGWYRNLVSAALYVLSPRVLGHVTPGAFADFGRDVFPGLVERGVPLFAYNTPEYIKDVGTPERLRAVERDLESGRVARRNRRRPRPAVFFDRDGVLNRDSEGHVTSPDMFTFLPGAVEAVKHVNASDHLAVVVTNQPMIAKGFVSPETLATIHARMETALGAAGAYVDRIYHCPHHPEGGHEGERPELKVDCDCRKPRPGMIERAIRELGIRREGSYIIGDRTSDMAAGRAAGIGTVLVRTGAAGGDGKCDVEPDFVCDGVGAAVELILGGGDNRRAGKPQSQKSDLAPERHS